MSYTSKTGLIPAQCNRFHKIHKTPINKELSDYFARNISRPIEFSIRPFGDLYNPFQSSRCSVLCNHPAPQILRNIIKNAKNSKSPADCKNCNIINTKKKQNNFNDFELDEQNTIPEELFRRFRDNDSRPMTPSPTNASIQTRTSITGSIVNARRCITPEWGKSDVIKRKQIILDLRRSHSQETILSKGASELSYGLETKSRIIDQKVALNICSQIDDNKGILLPPFIEQLPLEELQPQIIHSPTQCINDRDDIDQPDRRRGRKKKKLKQQPTFHLNCDPETQVSTLGPESVNVSTRPSLIPNDQFSSTIDQTKRSEEEEALKDSFLTVDAFRVLSSGLDVDLLEETFERYLHRALKEAMKFISLKKSKNLVSEDQKNNSPSINENKQILLSDIDNKIPRKLSKSSCRFEIPLDLKELERISVLEYLSKYVWLSRQRKQMFKKIFLKYLDLSDEAQELSDRTMSLNYFDKALLEVLGYYANDDIVEKINELVEIKKHDGLLTFRTWCGIVSFAERLALLDDIKSCAGKYDGEDSDSCEELEKSDFDTFEERKVFCAFVPEKLSTVLGIIRSVQRKEYWQQFTQT